MLLCMRNYSGRKVVVVSSNSREQYNKSIKLIGRLYSLLCLAFFNVSMINVWDSHHNIFSFIIKSIRKFHRLLNNKYGMIKGYYL